MAHGITGNDKLRVAVLGCGTVSRWHLNGWKRNPQTEVQAVYDIIGERAGAAAKAFEVPDTGRDYREVLERDDVEAVDICLPHYLHAEAAIAAAKAGKHVLVEKPMANSLEEAVEMVRVCRENGVKLMVGHIFRFHPYLRLIKDIVAGGFLGNLNLINYTLLAYKDIPLLVSGDATDWRIRPELAGGGQLHDDGVHYLDLMRWFAGEEVVRVYAEIGIYLWDIPIETAAQVSLRFKGGAMGMFQMTCGYRGRPIREIIINGSAGAIKVSITGPVFNGRADIEIKSDRLGRVPEIAESLSPLGTAQWGISEYHDQLITLSMPQKDHFTEEVGHFVQAITEDTDILASGEEGVRALELVTAAFRSAKERRAIDLPLVNLD